ncbi:hypothetical protein CoNPh35_CDS0052 [Staphylococcus phage S-CoN_Ph35]|nr:hypothetical protein CoNPh35_CDS0052 [Staphylococcus phage S-CoN_Ph35]
MNKIIKYHLKKNVTKKVINLLNKKKKCIMITTLKELKKSSQIIYKQCVKFLHIAFL